MTPDALHLPLESPPMRIRHPAGRHPTLLLLALLRGSHTALPGETDPHHHRCHPAAHGLRGPRGHFFKGDTSWPSRR